MFRVAPKDYTEGDLLTGSKSLQYEIVSVIYIPTHVNVFLTVLQCNALHIANLV